MKQWTCKGFSSLNVSNEASDNWAHDGKDVQERTETKGASWNISVCK